jgi:hypothetical protein
LVVGFTGESGNLVERWHVMVTSILNRCAGYVEVRLEVEGDTYISAGQLTKEYSDGSEFALVRT